MPGRARDACAATPWARGGVVIRPRALAALEAAVLAGYGCDEEACGYLAGPAAEPLVCDEHVALENLARRLHARDPVTYFRSARTYFEVDLYAFEGAHTRALAAARPIKVLYHSHLDTGAYFSPTDKAAMSRGHVPEHEGGPAVLGPGPYWPLAFLVTSVAAGRIAEHRLFVWEGGDFVAAPHVVEAALGASP
ncbi:MAG: Mov34/MPN/PAD-1 family protein [Polyangiaceae bacterium]|nr:Mov34/MPN/PAD-1 family protein [Polyangiaceae bacterium]